MIHGGEHHWRKDAPFLENKMIKVVVPVSSGWGIMDRKRALELLYDRSYGKDRERYYREWRKIASELPIVTAPERFSAPKTTNRC